MPRSKKPRHCECPTKGSAYKPSGIPLYNLEQIILHTDELEAIRLCDHLGLTQAQAGERMGISRGTVQRIITSARQKVACALTQCKALVLEHPTCGKHTPKEDK